MIILTPFEKSDFDKLISWIDSKELMLTVAGTEWQHPLSTEQLESYLNKGNSHSFNIVHETQVEPIGHAELILFDNGLAKIDKLIIGDTAFRGKGLCPTIIKELINFAFTELSAHSVELNVFDWNQGAIRCYESAGFSFNAAKQQTFDMDGEEWVALNMLVEQPIP